MTPIPYVLITVDLRCEILTADESTTKTLAATATHTSGTGIASTVHGQHSSTRQQGYANQQSGAVVRRYVHAWGCHTLLTPAGNVTATFDGPVAC